MLNEVYLHYLRVRRLTVAGPFASSNRPAGGEHHV
jgi:hypothetical protein